MRFVFVLILTVDIVFNTASGYVRQSPCTEVYYTQRNTCRTRWFRRRCNYVHVTNYRCCSGYAGSSCDIPICGGGAIANSCNLVEGHVTHKDGTVVTNSGGTCIKPYTCSDCNEGYFVPVEDKTYCKACRRIENCNLPLCTKHENTYCAWCVGEIRRELPGHNVYTGKPDNTLCQRACSWRDGYRCFPGTCTGDMLFARDCKCAIGFSGSNCATATGDKLPIILEQIFVLEGEGDNKKLIVDMALGNEKYWTNIAQWSTVMVNTSSTYKPEIDPTQKPNYIKGYTIGIADMFITATLTRDMNESVWSSKRTCTFTERCDYSTEIDLQHSPPWDTIIDGDFNHRDS